jgi:putative transposase
MNIKQVTVKREYGKWYAIVACEFAKPIFQFIDPQKSVGIDVGIAKFVHDSDNNVVENPLFLKHMIKPLRRVQRKVSRRQKGSNNYKKAVSWLQRLHMRIANKRRDFLHKTSSYYSKWFNVVFLERLSVLNMVKTHHLARSIIDSGWGTFKHMLRYKCKMIVEVPAPYTTIKCSRCGHNVQKSLAVRTHCCNNCGLVLDRDHNASLNIKYDGLRLLLNLPVERREVTPVETLQCESVKQESKKRGYRSLHGSGSHLIQALFLHR